MLPARQLLFFLALLTQLITSAKLTNLCPDVPKLHILPGFGWDALTSTDKQQLTQSTYDQCKQTDDGKYTIPDNTVAVALNDEIHTIAEIFPHWTNYTPPSATFYTWPQEHSSIRYSFSDDQRQMKNLQIKHDAFTCRSQIRRLSYRIHSTSDVLISQALKERFLTVIHALDSNHVQRATYHIEKIVADYGTHYTKSIDVGEAFIQEDYLRNVFLNANNDRSKIIAASKLSLRDYVSVFGKDQQDLDSSLVSQYNAGVVHKRIRRIGGSDWGNDANISTMMVVDKSGDSLSSLINRFNFPNGSASLLNTIKEMLGDAVQLYFAKNIHRGCTQPKSANFDYIANLDDGLCKPAFQHVFGGVYESCERVTFDRHHGDLIAGCNQGQKINPMTGTSSCPTNFDASIIHSRHEYNYVHIHLFSCIAETSLGLASNYMFGGLYSTYVNNVVTNNKSCPPLYATTAVLGGELNICTYNGDDDSAKQHALPFGGFASCVNEFQCPVGYKKHLAVSHSYNSRVHFSKVRFTSENIYYCLREVDGANFGAVSVLNQPPFGNVFDEEIADEFECNSAIVSNCG